MNPKAPRERRPNPDDNLGIVTRLREKHPQRLLSELVDAVHLAIAFAPSAEWNQTEAIATYILENLTPPRPES